MRLFSRPESAPPPPPAPKPPRGVTVFTGDTAEHYPSADYWLYDDKAALDIFDAEGQCVATFLVGTWLRVEAGAYESKSESK